MRKVIEREIKEIKGNCLEPDRPAIQEHIPSVVLLDSKMPGIGGLEVLSIAVLLTAVMALAPTYFLAGIFFALRNVFNSLGKVKRL